MDEKIKVDVFISSSIILIKWMLPRNPGKEVRLNSSCFSKTVLGKLFSILLRKTGCKAR